MSCKPCVRIIQRAVTFLLVLRAVTLHRHRAVAAEPTDDLMKMAQSTFGIIEPPQPAELERPIVRLGRRLFWDERLSANGQVACASCHSAATWGADTERFSLDAKGKRTKRNSQSVSNATLQPALRWTSMTGVIPENYSDPRRLDPDEK